MKHTFKRQNLRGKGKKARVKDSWRRPRGIDNKLRKKLRAYGVMPDIGYRSAKKERCLHPCGLPEVLVCTEKDFASLDSKKFCVRFSSTLGRKKRDILRKSALTKGFKLVN